MKQRKTVIALGIIEILIGSITLLVTAISLLMFSNTKTPNVLAFVIITASLSTSIGIGLLKQKKIARDLLVYFSSLIVISKVLILSDIIRLNGNLLIYVPISIKNLFSILYHIFIIVYLTRPSIKKIFVN